MYDDFSYQHNQELNSTTSSAIFPSDGLIVPAFNPYNPTGEPLAPQVRLLEFGQRKQEAIIENIRNVVGIRLTNLPNNWFVQAWFLYAESDGHTHENNYLSKSGLQAALNGTFPGLQGQFFNPFVDQSAVEEPNPQFEKVLKITPDDHARTDLTLTK